MTKEEIQKLLEQGGERYCSSCQKFLPYSQYYIKSTANSENSFRFSSPCKKCAHDNRNKTYQKFYQIKRKYKLSEKDIKRMLDSQQMSCSICKTHVSKLGKTLSIDHCHSTGAVRELLCSSCNSLFGFSKENVDILKSAIEYISKHNKNRQA